MLHPHFLHLLQAHLLVHFPAPPTFPAVFSLDVNVFLHYKIKAPRPQTIIQDHIFKVIGDEVKIRSTVGAHFFTVFTWMAIVKKEALTGNLSFGR